MPWPAGYGSPFGFAVDPSSGAMYLSYVIASGDASGYGAVLRLSAEGALDQAFAGDGRAELLLRDRVEIVTLLVQSDGKVVAGGSTREVPGDRDPVLFRLRPDGLLDDWFDVDGKRVVSFGQDPDGDDRTQALALSSGRIVLVGPVEVNDTPRFGIARLDNSLIFSDGFERGSSAAWSAP